MRGVSASPNSSCSFTASTGDSGSPWSSSAYSMPRCMPDGTSIRVGTSRSMRWRAFQSIPDFKASDKSSDVNASSRVLPANAGSSQASSDASSASSDRSGSPSSGSHARRHCARTRHCDSASPHGSADSPSSRTASANARAACCGLARPTGFDDNTMPSKRSMRSLTSARFSASQRTSSPSRKCAANSSRSIASSTGAPRSSSESLASKRNSLATIHG